MAYATRDWAPLVGNGVVYGCGLLWVVLAARHRLRRRVALEVSSRTVARTCLSGRGPGRRVEWPRTRVREIKFNSSNGKLIIRVTGVAFVEVYLGPNRELNRHVADILSAALRSPLPAEPVTAAEAARHLHADAGETLHSGVRSRGLRRALLTLSILMAAAGLVMVFLPLPMHAIGFYVLIFAVAPAGIALGTQEKDFYV